MPTPHMQNLLKFINMTLVFYLGCQEILANHGIRINPTINAILVLTDIFGPNGTSARQFVAESQVNPQMQLFGDVVALQRCTVPFDESLGIIGAPGRELQVR